MSGTRTGQPRPRGGRLLVGRHFWHGSREVVIELAWGPSKRHPDRALPPGRVALRYLDDGSRCVRPFRDLARRRPRAEKVAGPRSQNRLGRHLLGVEGTFAELEGNCTTDQLRK